MNQVLMLTGVTGRKSGGAFAEYIGDHYEQITSLFSGGIQAIVRPSSKTDQLKKWIPSIELHTGEMTDMRFLANAFSGVDTVVHIAGIIHSKNIVDAAVQCKVRRLVLVHTAGIYSKYKSAGEGYRHTDEYVVQKCKENHIVLTICRPTMIYGNRYDKNMNKFIKMVDRFPLMPIINGGQYEIQPVHYRDLAKAYYDILISEEATANKAFLLSGDRPIYLRDALIVIGKNLGKKVRFINCPFQVAYVGAWIVYWATRGKKDFREKVQRLCESRAFSHEEATTAFGYQPICFEEGIAEEVAAYLDEKDKYSR